MNANIKRCINQSNAQEIAEHLDYCDNLFKPSLSSRVNIEQYALKIFNNATRFEALEQGKIVGLVAIYCNTEERVLAYITSVSVNRGRQGAGIGSYLLDDGIKYIKSLGFKAIELEVDSENINAINLYERKGFSLYFSKSNLRIMRLEI
jgi:ribosomal protein S18 acetylase RimI-like enzyme